MKAKATKDNRIVSLENHNEVPKIRRFALYRTKDISGKSGCGYVAAGVIFGSGTCIIEFNSVIKSHSTYHSIADMEKVHHINEGHTEIRWLDTDNSASDEEDHN